MFQLLSIFFIGIIFLISCNSITENRSEYRNKPTYIEPLTTYNPIEDGKYCAEVRYSNPASGKVSNYELIVEVKDRKVTVIHWPNGGWLDESHFVPKEINDEGDVSILSDKGYKYDIQLLSERPCKFENQ